VAAGFVAVVVHTWMYAAFLEDPVTWTLLAVGAVLARRPRSRRRAPLAATLVPGRLDAAPRPEQVGRGAELGHER
jgi:hypothetical protein